MYGGAKEIISDPIEGVILGVSNPDIEGQVMGGTNCRKTTGNAKFDTDIESQVMGGGGGRK